jgi:hypothetical protein
MTMATTEVVAIYVDDFSYRLSISSAKNLLKNIFIDI